jgi:predicted neutral ceramidase superfamily lipid hydrolase
MPLKVRVSRKTSNFIYLIGLLILGVASLYIAFFIPTATRQETVLLALAGIVHFFVFWKSSRDEIDFSGWSLPSILWALVAIYSFWMMIKYLDI